MGNRFALKRKNGALRFLWRFTSMSKINSTHLLRSSHTHKAYNSNSLLVLENRTSNKLFVNCTFSIFFSFLFSKRRKIHRKTIKRQKSQRKSVSFFSALTYSSSKTQFYSSVFRWNAHTAEKNMLLSPRTKQFIT